MTERVKVVGPDLDLGMYEVPDGWKPRYLKDMSWLERNYSELKRRFNYSRIGWTLFFFRNFRGLLSKNSMSVFDYRIVKKIRDDGGVFDNEDFNI